MSVNYGSNIKPPMLLNEQIGKIEEQENDNTFWLSIVEWGSIIAEVVIGMIPGVGMLADAGIAVAGAGIRTAAKAASGEGLSSTDVGLDFGTALIPAISGISKGLKSAKILKEAGATGLSRFTTLKEIAPNIKIPSGKQTTEIGKFISPKTFKKYTEIAKKGYEGKIGEWAITTNGKGLTKVGDVLKPSSLVKLENIGNAGSKTASAIAEAGVGGARESGSFEHSSAEAFGRSFAKEFKISFREFKSLSRELRMLPKAERAAYLTAEMVSFGKTADEIAAAAVKMKNILKNFSHFSNNYNIGRAMRGATNKTIKMLFKGLQYVANPTTIVSKMVEKTIGKAAEKIAEKVGEKWEKVSKILKKGAKGAKELEEDWIKTGGLRMKNKESTIFGVKVINENPAAMVVLVKFDPWKTSGKTGKNVGGKKDVVVEMPLTVMNEFINHSHPMKMYLDTWARSRGGAHAHEASTLMVVESIVGFLPIDAIGEYIGMTSYVTNTIKNAGNMKWAWTGDFWMDIGKQLAMTIPQESFKLVAAFAPGRIGKSFTENAVKGAVFNHQGVLTAGFSQVSSEAGRLRGETGSGKAFEKISAARGMGSSIKSL